MVDTPVLGTGAEMRVGSSPTFGTKKLIYKIKISSNMVKKYHQYIKENNSNGLEIYHTKDELENKNIVPNKNHVGLKKWGSSEGIRGKLLEEDEIPNKLYHVTTNKKEVLNSGTLKAGAKGGFGGGQLRGVSFTSDYTIAQRMVNGIKGAIILFNCDNMDEIEKTLIQIANTDSEFAGVDVTDKAKSSIKYMKFRREKSSEPLIDTIEMGYRQYLMEIERKSDKLINPILLGTEYLKGLNVENVGIITVNKNNIPDKAAVIEGTDYFLKEIRVLSEVSIK